jgi:peptidoglycan hydrolase-like protein with peptidoglycan-binding domain
MVNAPPPRVRIDPWYTKGLRTLKFLLVALLGLGLFSAGLSFAKTAKRTSRSTASKSTSKKKASSNKKSAAKVSRATAAKKSSVKRKASTRTRRASRSKRTTYRRAGQQVPTRERYLEIQRALADKGYFTGNVDGVWGADSVEALKHFQHDQNVPETGKLNSVSLIGLGLGPKRNLNALSTTPAAKDPNVESRPPDDHRGTEGSQRP